MKTRILFLLLLAVSISFSACKKETEGDKTENTLVGKWTIGETSVEITVEGVDVIEYMVTNFGYTTEEAQSVVDSFIQEINDGNTGTINFKSDNTYQLSFTNTNDEEDGTWSVSSDGNTLNLYFDNEEDNLPILSLTSSLAMIGINDQEDVDLDDDGENETILDLDMALSLSK